MGFSARMPVSTDKRESPVSDVRAAHEHLKTVFRVGISKRRRRRHDHRRKRMRAHSDQRNTGTFGARSWCSRSHFLTYRMYCAEHASITMLAADGAIRLLAALPSHVFARSGSKRYGGRDPSRNDGESANASWYQWSLGHLAQRGVSRSGVLRRSQSTQSEGKRVRAGQSSQLPPV